MKDKSVRQALIMATDRDLLVKQVLRGAGTPAVGPVHPQSRFVDKDLRPYPYDPAKAKSMLEAAGFPFDTTLTIIAQAQRPTIEQSLAVIQQQWASIGVKSAIQLLDAGALLAKCRAANEAERPDVCMFGSSFATGIPDPGQTTNFFKCNAASNVSYMCDPEVDKAFDDGATDNTAARTAAYAKLQRLLYDDAPSINLYYRGILNAYNTRVNEFVIPNVFGAQQPWKWDVR
jgi:dipeptide transport system substrate-binding protein